MRVDFRRCVEIGDGFAELAEAQIRETAVLKCSGIIRCDVKRLVAILQRIRQITVGGRARPAAGVKGLGIVWIDFERLAGVIDGMVEVVVFCVCLASVDAGERKFRIQPYSIAVVCNRRAVIVVVVMGLAPKIIPKIVACVVWIERDCLGIIRDGSRSLSFFMNKNT